MGPEKEEIPKTSRQQSRMVPRCPAYVGLCATFAGRVRKQPLAPIPAPLGRFCGTLEKAGFFRVSVGHPGLGEIEITFTNQPNLTSFMACPKGWFTL